MTELDLYKFINDNSIEWRREINDGADDIIIFLYTFQLDGFIKLIKKYSFDDGGLEVRLMDGYLCIWMNHICEYFGIEMDNVFVGNPYK